MGLTALPTHALWPHSTERESRLLDVIHQATHIGDKGHTSVPRLITPIKKPAGCELHDTEKGFNKKVNTIRYLIEQTHCAVEDLAYPPCRLPPPLHNLRHHHQRHPRNHIHLHPMNKPHWSSKQIAVIVGHSGRDVSFVSEVPDAQEITYLPGTIFHMHASMVIDGMQARIFEECMPSENGLDAMNIDPDDVFRSVRDIIRKRRHEPLRVPLEYCKRFVGRLE